MIAFRECAGGHFEFYAYNAAGEVQIHSWARGSAGQMEFDVYQSRLDDRRDPVVRVEVYRHATSSRYPSGGCPDLTRKHWQLLPGTEPRVIEGYQPDAARRIRNVAPPPRYP